MLADQVMAMAVKFQFLLINPTRLLQERMPTISVSKSFGTNIYTVKLTSVNHQWPSYATQINRINNPMIK